mgnify:FL=1
MAQRNPGADGAALAGKRLPHGTLVRFGACSVQRNRFSISVAMPMPEPSHMLMTP